MSGMELQFDVDIADGADLARLLGLESAADAEFPSRVAELAAVAFEEVSAWATGRRRDSTLGEIERRRVLRLFAEIRRQPATIERLVEELGFTESRARTMVGRLRFSDARLLRGLTLREAHGDLEDRRANAVHVAQQLQVNLPKSTYAAVREAESDILLDEHGKYPGATAVNATVRGYVVCLATEKMWRLVSNWLDTRATELGA
jgi:hypothetical protein